MGSRYAVPSPFIEIKRLLARSSPTMNKVELLDLADLLHEVIRNRRDAACLDEPRSFNPVPWSGA